MRIVIDHQGADSEFDIALSAPDASVGDLVAAVVPGADVLTIMLEGRRVGLDALLGELGLYEGARLTVDAADDTNAPPPRSPPRPGDLVIAVAGGLCSGARHCIGSGALIGRAADCDIVLADPAVSAHHARLWREAGGRLLVADLGSRNGTWCDGDPVVGATALAIGARLRAGATELRVSREDDADRHSGIDPTPGGAREGLTFNRPPRSAPPRAPAALQAPAPDAPRDPPRSLSVTAVLAPLALGAALVLLYGDPRFALFMLLSPAMAVGTWMSSRRQARRQARRSARAFRHALGAFDEAHARVVAEERRRREAALPDLAEVVRRATARSTRLWERRRDDDDALRLRVGTGPVPWRPPLSTAEEEVDASVLDRLAGGVIPWCPVEVDLGAGVVGLVGDRPAALALARALVCQLVVHHGPADVGVAVLAASGRREPWGWAAWLPHARDGLGRPLLTSRREAADELAGRLLAGPAPAGTPMRTVAVVLDDVALLEGRSSPVRQLLQADRSTVVGIVLAETADQLPAVTGSVIALDDELGSAALTRPREGTGVADIVAGGLAQATARELARTLARYEDPELAHAGTGVPTAVRLPPLLGLDEIDVDGVDALWATGARDPRLRAPLGVTDAGPLWVDLVADGPHALIAGTTGSGKSELLRSLVAGLAVHSAPEHLVFVLVDYKGGSAFDACADLPHCVGLVTDLDAHLGERALRSLAAEVRHRERLLREAEVADLPGYLAVGAPAGPLPRLVVVVDEFATLAVELPDFLGALVGIAQRGRSLGIHLVLATQRPAGVVSAAITANTNLRIALRVQDSADSTDVIGGPDAAAIPRGVPGRAYARVGPREVAYLQAPLATGRSAGDAPRVAVRAVHDGLVAEDSGGSPTCSAADGGASSTTDLGLVVAAAGQAVQRRGSRPPRRPWLEMLPPALEFTDLGPPVDGDLEELRFGLADDPDRQRRTSVGWRPALGHLAIFGTVGSGKTTALRALAQAIAAQHDPASCHLYAIDAASGGLAPLAGHVHCGAVATANEIERRLRILRRVRGEVDRRRTVLAGGVGSLPRIIVLVDGVAALLAEADEPDGLDAGEAFRRILADGPSVGVSVAMTADRPSSVPLRLTSGIGQRILLRLADPGEYASAGLRARALPALVPGRGVRAEDALVLQIAEPGQEPEPAARAASGRSGGPLPVGLLPSALPSSAIPPAEPRAADAAGVGLSVTLGLGDADLAGVELSLGPWDRALVAGPRGSGKSWTLMLLAERLRAADPELVLVGVSAADSPLQASGALDAAGTCEELAVVLTLARDDTRAWVVLVDDALDVSDPAGHLAALGRPGRAGLHLVVAGVADDLRRAHTHWTRPVRQSRRGILLQPDLTADGELLGVRLPRRIAVPLTPGRGFVVGDGEAVLAQLATPASAERAGVD